MRRFLAALVWVFCLGGAQAGVLGQGDLEKLFPDALRIGPRDGAVPVWPIVKLDGPTEKVVAYVFESVDLAPIPGFAGTPFNLLIALDGQGEFLEVRVISQHEPVFLDGLGPEPLFRFVEQYKGRNLRQTIKVGHRAEGGLDGVTKATASVRIVNETVLSAALQVARAKLGFAQGRTAAEVARVRTDGYVPLTWRELVDRGYVKRLAVSNQEAEEAFRGSVGEGMDEEAKASPEALTAELWAAYLNVPAIGRNVLGEAGWQRLQERLEPGQHAILVVSAGRQGYVDEHFTRGGVPDRLALRQGGLPIDMRDLDLEPRLALAGSPEVRDIHIFRIIAQSGFDPGLPWQLALRLSRQKGLIWPETAHREFTLDYGLPDSFFERPAGEGDRAWLAVWRDRARDLAVLAGLLAVLTAALLGQRWLVAGPRRLAAFRWGFLTLTLGFVGWHAQGQLSIVNVLGPLKAALGSRDFAFLLYDPVTLVVSVFTLASLVVWGRGAFCGWLCPFGTLQEFVGKAAQKLGLRQLRVSDRADRLLGRVKYFILAAILGAAVAAPALADRLVEAEPFKTAITLVFQRGGPALAYALAVLALGAVAYKGYCRWLCPLGAGLAILGGLRRWNWLPRRRECGQPCQLCRHRCEYRAIETDGAIRYRDCFQCLDCVAIHEDRRRCVPLVLMDRRGKTLEP